MYFDDLRCGMTTEIAPAVVEREKMLSFAREYDNIPLHTDEEYAKGSPFGRLIAPGVMSFMTLWAKYLEVDFFGEELLAGKSTRIEWLAPVFAEDVLRGRATVTALRSEIGATAWWKLPLRTFRMKCLSLKALASLSNRKGIA